MKRIFLLFTAVCSLTIVSCSEDDQDVVQNPYEVFAGTWQGTFSGDDHGTWTANINNQGEVSGTVHSEGYDITFTLSGTVNELGVLEAHYNYQSSGLMPGGNFNGTLTSNTGNGQWDSPNDAMNGTWEGTKNN